MTEEKKKKRMTTSSCKAKGRNAQKEFREKILCKFPELTENDVYSRPMGSPGVDLMLSQKAIDILKASYEIKYHKKINIWNAWKQAKENTIKDTKPVLVIREKNIPGNFLVILDSENYLDLLKK